MYMDLPLASSALLKSKIQKPHEKNDLAGGQSIIRLPAVGRTFLGAHPPKSTLVRFFACVSPRQVGPTNQ